jgi:hypothetical protein
MAACADIAAFRRTGRAIAVVQTQDLAARRFRQFITLPVVAAGTGGATARTAGRAVAEVFALNAIAFAHGAERTGTGRSAAGTPSETRHINARRTGRRCTAVLGTHRLQNVIHTHAFGQTAGTGQVAAHRAIQNGPKYVSLPHAFRGYQVLLARESPTDTTRAEGAETDEAGVAIA